MKTENRARKTPVRKTAAKAVASRRQETPAPAEETSPGETIAQHRHARGMTLAKLSELSSVAISTISRVENGRISPTYAVLSRLAKALDIRWPDMVGGNDKSFAQGCRAVSRAGHGIKHPTSTGVFEWLGTELVTKSMEPTLIEATADTGKHTLSAHDGQEFIYVTEGTLLFLMRDYAPLTLEKGDSIYFDAGTPHACYGVKLPTRYLSIVARP